jgi:predicted AlkP superfamily phosphohydrolase/phosphomutase
MKKVLVIGLDGAEPTILFSLAEEGKLPAIKKLMEGGAYGNMKSTIPSHSGPAWSSMVTGKNPGKHGVFDFNVYSPGDKKVRLLNAKDRKAKAVWDILSEKGLKAGVMNVPLTYPPSEVNGFLVCGFLTPGEWVTYTYPPELGKELTERFGYKIEIDPKVYNDAEDKDPFIAEVYRTTEKREKAAAYLMEKYGWDLFFIVFDELDRMEHFFWRYVEKKHPRYSKEASEKYGKAVEDYYIRLDAAVGRLVEKAGDACVFIVSDHGHGQLYKNIDLNSWLMGLGLLAFKKESGAAKAGVTRAGIRRLFVKFGLMRFNYLISGIIPKKVKMMLPEDKNSVVDGIDWSKTKAYSYGWGSRVYINLRGRSSAGIVEESEYDSLCKRITEELYKLKDPESGEAVVERVYSKGELYSGSFLENAPDLIFTTKDEKYLGVPNIGKKLFSDSVRSGTHKLNGVLLFSDAGTKRKKFDAVSIYDVTPTILHILGLPVPSDVDGKVLMELFNPECEYAKREVKKDSADEKELLRRKIKKLKDLDRL